MGEMRSCLPCCVWQTTISSWLMSPLRCTGMKSSPTSSSTTWIGSGKNTVDSGGSGWSREERDKGNDMWNKLRKSTLSQAIEDWCRLLFSLGSFFSLLSIPFYWSCGPAVCLFIFKNNLATQFDATRGALQRHPSGSFSHRLVCRAQLHMQVSESEPVGSFPFWLLFTWRGQRDRPSFFPPSLLSVSERSWWLRESQWRHRSSKRRSPCHDRNNAGAVFHGRKGTNKNTNRVVRARARPRSFCLTLCFWLLNSSLAWEWLNTMQIGATRDRSKLTIEPTSRSGRLTARPVIKRPAPPVITHWDEVINMIQPAPDFFFSSISPFSRCSQSVFPQGATDVQSRGSGSSAYLVQTHKHLRTPWFSLLPDFIHALPALV